MELNTHNTQVSRSTYGGDNTAGRVPRALRI